MDIGKCINDIKNLPPPRKTFMEIMKVHESEVHLANLLAYFFRSEEKHGLGKTFLKSLFETKTYGLKHSIGTQDQSAPLFKYSYELDLNSEKFNGPHEHLSGDTIIEKLSRVHVMTEEPTFYAKDKQKRIDLLLTTDDCVVCIEFKINHDLNNPLKTYQKHIRELELDFWKKTNKKRELFFIVLTPFKKQPAPSVQSFIDRGENVFREMVISHLADKLVKNIPENYFVENINNTHSQYLVEFVQTINNRKSRYYQLEILKDLESRVKEKFRTKLLGDHRCLEMYSDNFKLKIRIKMNKQFVIEKWTKTNELERSYPPLELSNENDYQDIINELNAIVKLNKQTE